jgi:phenylacetate-coenzyme A ligase PaaK-like adenylate-forming protein
MRDFFPTGLAPDDKDIEAGLLREEIEYTFTSGTTGDRVVNIWDQDWWDRAEASSWKLNAHTARLSYPQREAKLASSLNVGVSCEEDLPMEARVVGHKLYLNEKINLIQWQPRHFIRMARELESFQPVVLEANPSLLARLAWWAIDEGVALYSPAVIVFTFEFISQIHVEAIRKVFSSDIISSYGTTETGFVMEECEKGFLHQNVDFCRIDFHPLKDRYGGPELGRMLVTTFQNPWNIVLRFDVGDLVRLHKSGECPCGRKEGFIAEAIEGRASNSTFTTDGGMVTTMALDAALAGVEGLRDYHLEQNTPTQYELQVMTRCEPKPVIEACHHALEALYGRDGRYDIKMMNNILPGPAGKFRRTQANFDFDVRELFI